MSDNVIDFPCIETRSLAAASRVIARRELTDGERMELLDAIENGVRVLNAATRRAHGGVHYDLRYSEA